MANRIRASAKLQPFSGTAENFEITAVFRGKKPLIRVLNKQKQLDFRQQLPRRSQRAYAVELLTTVFITFGSVRCCAGAGGTMEYAVLLCVGIPIPIVLAIALSKTLARRRTRGSTHDYHDPMTREDLSDEDFFHTFRFRREHIARLAAALRLPESIVTKHGHRASREVALLYTLFKYAKPHDYLDCKLFFGPDETTISRIVREVETHAFNSTIRHLISFHPTLVTRPSLTYDAERIAAKGCLLPNVWGFIDGCKWEIARPGGNITLQRVMYSGYTGTHCCSYQVITAPDGLLLHIYGPCQGRENDLNVLEQSCVLSTMQAHPGEASSIAVIGSTVLVNSSHEHL